MPLITTSENLGSGGMSIARRVAQKLDINLYDDQRLQKEAVDLGIRTEDLKKGMEEKAPGFFDQIRGKRPDVYMDLNDSSLYDLIINTEKIGENTAVQFIVDLAASDEIKACSLTALETMERLALEKKIHAELMKTNIDLKFIHIDVIEPGVARISGMVLSPDDQTKITETVESVAGISSVQAQIVPIPQGYA